MIKQMIRRMRVRFFPSETDRLLVGFYGLRESIQQMLRDAPVPIKPGVFADAEGTWLVQKDGSKSFMATWPEVFECFRDDVRRMLNRAAWDSMPGVPKPYELSSRFAGNYIAAIIHEGGADGHESYDEEIGSVDELGFYGVQYGACEPDAVMRLLLATDYNISVEQYRTLTNMAGCITYVNDQGFVYVTTYESRKGLDLAWKAIEKMYVEHDSRCSECDNPIAEGSDDLCSSCAKTWAEYDAE